MQPVPLFDLPRPTCEPSLLLLGKINWPPEVPSTFHHAKLVSELSAVLDLDYRFQLQYSSCYQSNWLEIDFDLTRSPLVSKRRSSSVFSPVRTPGKRQSLRRSLLGSSAKKTGFIVTEILKGSDNDAESCAPLSPGK